MKLKTLVVVAYIAALSFSSFTYGSIALADTDDVKASLDLKRSAISQNDGQHDGSVAAAVIAYLTEHPALGDGVPLKLVRVVSVKTVQPDSQKKVLRHFEPRSALNRNQQSEGASKSSLAKKLVHAIVMNKKEEAQYEFILTGDPSNYSVESARKR